MICLSHWSSLWIRPIPLTDLWYLYIWCFTSIFNSKHGSVIKCHCNCRRQYRSDIVIVSCSMGTQTKSLAVNVFFTSWSVKRKLRDAAHSCSNPTHVIFNFIAIFDRSNFKASQTLSNPKALISNVDPQSIHCSGCLLMWLWVCRFRL